MANMKLNLEGMDYITLRDGLEVVEKALAAWDNVQVYFSGEQVNPDDMMVDWQDLYFIREQVTKQAKRNNWKL